MRSPLAAVIAVAAAFAIVIGSAFQLRPYAARMSDDVFGTIAGVSICAVAFLLFWALRGFPMPGRGPRIRHMKEGSYYVTEGEAVPCEHLRPVLQALVEAGIKVHTSHYASAECFINGEALLQAGVLPKGVAYVERFESERAQDDIAIAELTCKACRAKKPWVGVINVYHPRENRADRPWFPAPPANSDGQ